MGIELVDFAQEEDRDKEGVRLALIKYNPLFQHLFDKYTAKTNMRQQAANDRLVEKQIATGDLIKLVRDHNISHSLLSKTELSTFVKLINRKMVCRYEDDALDYQGFAHFFV